MRSKLLPLLLAFGAGAVISGALVGHAANIDKEAESIAEIDAVVLEMNRSLHADDVEAWAKCHTEPLTMVFSDPITGQGLSMQFEERSLRRFVFQTERKTMPARFAEGDYTGLTKDIRFLSPTVCVIYATFVPQTPDEDSVPSEGYTILVKQGPDWKIAALVGGDAPS